MMLKGDSVPREGKCPYLPMIRMESFLYNMSLLTSDDSQNKNSPALINQWQMKIYIIDHVSCLLSWEISSICLVILSSWRKKYHSGNWSHILENFRKHYWLLEMSLSIFHYSMHPPPNKNRVKENKNIFKTGLPVILFLIICKSL